MHFIEKKTINTKMIEMRVESKESLHYINIEVVIVM